MNADFGDDHPSIRYYDSDYPSKDHGAFLENFDSVTEFQGIASDVERYLEIAMRAGGPVLELCCGTGRVAIPLARAGFDVVGVDISRGMLEKFKTNLSLESPDLAARIELVEQDVTKLSLEDRRFPLAILAFNSLLCIPDFAGQCRTLLAAADHLASGGILILDLVNPLSLSLKGDSQPKPFFTRVNTASGNTYTRFAMSSPMDENQVQRLYGWYDELAPDGSVRRETYSLYWRLIFRFEAEMMLRQAGFEVTHLEGGHRKEQFTAQSPRMFIEARVP